MRSSTVLPKLAGVLLATVMSVLLPGVTSGAAEAERPAQRAASPLTRLVGAAGYVSGERASVRVRVDGQTRLLFAATDTEHGTELWTSDGTRTGTRVLADIYRGKESSQPSELTVVGSRACFRARDAQHGYELWCTDGTRSGTSMVVDLVPGIESSSPNDLTAVADRIVFSAKTAAGGREPYVSSGRARDTRLLGDLRPGAASSNPGNFSAVGRRVVFSATTSASPAVEVVKPFVTDGTPSGTDRLDSYAADVSLAVGATGRLGRQVLLAAGDDRSGQELWVTRGVPGDAVGIRDILAGPGWSSPHDFTAVGPVSYFIAREDRHGQELWQTDGTTGGTVLVRDLVEGVVGSGPDDLTRSGPRLLFTADDVTMRRSLWVTEGSAPRTAKVVLPRADADRGPAVIGTVGDLVVVQGLSGGRARLWLTDGTPARTRGGPALGVGDDVSAYVLGTLGHKVLLFVGGPDAVSRGLFSWSPSVG